MLCYLRLFIIKNNLSRLFFYFSIGLRYKFLFLLLLPLPCELVFYEFVLLHLPWKASGSYLLTIGVGWICFYIKSELVRLWWPIWCDGGVCNLVFAEGNKIKGIDFYG